MATGRSLGGSDSTLHLLCDFWCWQTLTVATPWYRKEAQSMNGSSVVCSLDTQLTEACQMETLNDRVPWLLHEPLSKNYRTILKNFWHIKFTSKNESELLVFFALSGFYSVQKPSVGFITKIFVQIHFG